MIAKLILRLLCVLCVTNHMAGSEVTINEDVSQELKSLVSKLSDKIDAINGRLDEIDRKLSSQINSTRDQVEDLRQAVSPILDRYAAQQKKIEEDRFEHEIKYVKDHFEEVSLKKPDDHFLNLTADQLKQVLTSDDLNVTSEIQVFNGMMSWLRADDENRLGRLPEFLDLIRLRLVDVKDLMTTITEDPLIQNCTSCKALIQEVVILDLDPHKTASRDVPALVNLKPRSTLIQTSDDSAAHGQEASMKEVLLAIGGMNETAHLSSVELYDPDVRGWRELTRLTYPRAAAAAAVLDNKVYVCGGLDTKKSCIRYDVAQNKWDNSVASMLKERSHFGMATLGGAIYAVGGADHPKSMERYDPKRNQWISLVDLPFSMNLPGVAATRDAIYVAGGGRLLKYDPTVDGWVKLAKMESYRSELALLPVEVVSSSAREIFLYAIGGTGGSNKLTTVERYDMRAGSWTKLPALRESRTGLGGAVLGGNNLYVVGGYNDVNHYLASGERLSLTDYDALDWKPIASMITNRYYAALVTVRLPFK